MTSTQSITDKLVNDVANTAAFFTMEYMAAQREGRHLDYGLESKIRPIIETAIRAVAEDRSQTQHLQQQPGERDAR